jgi:membrane associated rhomboid family serine protease
MHCWSTKNFPPVIFPFVGFIGHVETKKRKPSLALSSGHTKETRALRTPNDRCVSAPADGKVKEHVPVLEFAPCLRTVNRAMLSDRSYMRDLPDRNPPSLLGWLLGLLLGVYVLQQVGRTWFNSDAIQTYGQLSSTGLRAGHLWSVLSYALLHGSLTHLLLNGLGLFFTVRALEHSLAPGRLPQLLFATALGGACGWLAVNFTRSGSVIGASGLLMGLLTVFVCLNPRRPMSVLLFLIIPITVQPIWFLAVLGGIDLLGLLFVELPGRGSLYGVAHSAHLGGAAMGYLFYRWVLARPSHYTEAKPAIELPKWFQRRAKTATPVFTAPLGAARSADRGRLGSGDTAREALRLEVDRILDKINAQGFDALNAGEKRVLDEARQKMNPR